MSNNKSFSPGYFNTLTNSDRERYEKKIESVV